MTAKQKGETLVNYLSGTAVSYNFLFTDYLSIPFIYYNAKKINIANRLFFSIQTNINLYFFFNGRY